MFLSKLKGSSPTALVATTLILISSAAISVVALRTFKVRRLKQQLEKDLEEAMQPDCETAYPEDLIREQLARNYAFLGERGQTQIRNAFVVVVGLGGVGSHA